jgi:hypothetical protein
MKSDEIMPLVFAMETAIRELSEKVAGGTLSATDAIREAWLRGFHAAEVSYTPEVKS